MTYTDTRTWLEAKKIELIFTNWLITGNLRIIDQYHLANTDRHDKFEIRVNDRHDYITFTYNNIEYRFKSTGLLRDAIARAMESLQPKYLDYQSADVWRLSTLLSDTKQKDFIVCTPKFYDAFQSARPAMSIEDRIIELLNSGVGIPDDQFGVTFNVGGTNYQIWVQQTVYPARHCNDTPKPPSYMLQIRYELNDYIRNEALPLYSSRLYDKLVELAWKPNTSNIENILSRIETLLPPGAE